MRRYQIDVEKAAEKATSHKDVGFLLVGVDVLGDPLSPKINPQKTKRIPRQIFKNLSGFVYSVR